MTREQLITMLDVLPDEAIDEVTLFLSYLRYKYVLKQSWRSGVLDNAGDAEMSDDTEPWNLFFAALRQIQQGPWQETRTSNEILSAMRR